ncbi:hypothetical protein EW146_g5464 [Bondarzewia mesenterica]|uniref:Calpain catalytic domain-containing protein n=1 Tax=Bondarzewia mesenterica TaxID=1095465 RepID=A0A4S4LRE2_9AGAM|nr:hypothetical protein EW146_g5464 [Bondarzewia mesenterica]
MLGRIFKYGFQPDTEGKKLPSDFRPREFDQPKERAGLLVTEEFDKAVEVCGMRVTRIANECKRQNRRYRDRSFDIYEDRDRCLYGLAGPAGSTSLQPSDVIRVAQVFDKPQFFVDGASSGDIVQGCLGNCWFLSALAMVGTVKGLIEKICVARDEKFGVYGFVFFRESGWNSVIVDDFLFSGVPKYDSLTYQEKTMYRRDRELYNKTARIGQKALYFGSSGTENETWVPLIEKAYAKLHGDYAALEGGHAREAVEDLTGGISSLYPVSDIFDTDAFWNEELMRANRDRLFGCFIEYDLANPQPIDGLQLSHAYSIICALEVKGKRFVKIRNPWGESEWTGKWSDGSKEWTKEWLEALPELNHKFGNDGEFLMECKKLTYDPLHRDIAAINSRVLSDEDFLSMWTVIERVRLFDSTWALSSHWLNVTSRAWSFGDVSFTINISSPTPTVIALTQVDNRAFRDIAGPYDWSLEFTLYKKDESEQIGQSVHDCFYTRSVQMELELEEGDYVVHVRLDRRSRTTHAQVNTLLDSADQRKAARKLASALQASSVASNFDSSGKENLLPIPEGILAGKSLTEVEKTLPAADAAAEKKDEDMIAVPLDAPMAENGVPKEGEANSACKEQDPVRETGKGTETGQGQTMNAGEDAGTTDSPPKPEVIHEGFLCNICNMDPIKGPRFHCTDPGCFDFDICQGCLDSGVHPQEHQLLRINVNVRAPPDAGSAPQPDTQSSLVSPADEKEEADDDITLGLRVYTKRTSTATVKVDQGNVSQLTKKTN